MANLHEFSIFGVTILKAAFCISSIKHSVQWAGRKNQFLPETKAWTNLLDKWIGQKIQDFALEILTKQLNLGNLG